MGLRCNKCKGLGFDGQAIKVFRELGLGFRCVKEITRVLDVFKVCGD